VNFRTVSLLLVIGLLSLAGRPQVQPLWVHRRFGAALASLALVSCQLEDPAKVAVVLAECGDLSVPENPADPGGRHIFASRCASAGYQSPQAAGPVVRPRWRSCNGSDDVLCVGGVLVRRIHRDRDIVLVDQRGTGKSNPLNCTLDDDDLYRATDAEIAAMHAAA